MVLWAYIFFLIYFRQNHNKQPLSAQHRAWLSTYEFQPLALHELLYKCDDNDADNYYHYHIITTYHCHNVCHFPSLSRISKCPFQQFTPDALQDSALHNVHPTTSMHFIRVLLTS